MKQVCLIYGNQKDKVQDARYQFIHRFLPNGEADGEVIDIRPPGNQPLKLEKVWSQIIEELGTVSLIPDAKRLVIVHNLSDFKSASRGSLREKKKTQKGKVNPVEKLEDYIRKSLVKSPHALLFLYEEDDEKGRFVSKTNPLFMMLKSVGDVQVFQEKRLDWQLEEAVLARDMNRSISLVREWVKRGGNAPFRLTTMLNGILQLILQARLKIDAQKRGEKTGNIYQEIRPSIDTVPEFKRKKVQQFAMNVSHESLLNSIHRLNQIQKSFFPKGTELIVHDPLEQLEVFLVELTKPS